MVLPPSRPLSPGAEASAGPGQSVIATSRSVSRFDEPVEQLVLRTFELLDRRDHGHLVPGHCVGVTSGFAMLLIGQRGFRHQRAEPRVVGVLGQVGQLFVGDGELTAGLAKSVGQLYETPFEQGA
jgi:hypothetical protein